MVRNSWEFITILKNDIMKEVEFTPEETKLMNQAIAYYFWFKQLPNHLKRTIDKDLYEAEKLVRKMIYSRR